MLLFRSKSYAGCLIAKLLGDRIAYREIEAFSREQESRYGLTRTVVIKPGISSYGVKGPTVAGPVREDVHPRIPYIPAFVDEGNREMFARISDPDTGHGSFFKSRVEDLLGTLVEGG